MRHAKGSGSAANKENAVPPPNTLENPSDVSGSQRDEQIDNERPAEQTPSPQPATSAQSAKRRGPGKKIKQVQPSTSTKAVWTSADDAVLVDALLDERALGHQSDSGFKSIAYTACAEALTGSEKVSGGVAKDANACSNHWAKLKHDFAIVKKLRDQSGFGWDEENSLPTASKEVWDAAIKANRKVAVWRKKPFPLYDNIAILVEHIMATGELAFRPGQPRHDQPIKDDDHSLHSSSDEEFSEGDLNSQRTSIGKRARASTLTTSEGSSTQGLTIHRSESSPPEKKKRRHTRPASPRQNQRTNAASISAVADSIQAMAASFKPPNEAGADRLQLAISTLENDQDLSDNEAADAVALFSSNSAIARAFSMTKSKSLRTSFIQRAIRQAADREFQQRHLGTATQDYNW